MSVKIGGPKPPVTPQVTTITTTTTTTTTTTMPQHIESNRAWEQLTNVQHSIPSQAPRNLANSPLRQQIALMSGSSNTLINTDNLAEQFGINTQDLILPQTADIQVNGGYTQSGYQSPSIGTSSEARSNPLAGSRTHSSPTTNPARKEAKAKFDAFLEQSHAMFDSKSDNMARSLSKDPQLLGALTSAEKGRLIETLSSGIKSEADEEAISRILGSAQDKAEFVGIVQVCGGPDRMASKLDGAEARNFEFLWDKFATDVGPSNSPVRNEARAAFEQILAKQHSFLDSEADTLARNLIKNPQQLASLSPTEKGRLIQILDSGWKSESDESAIATLLRSSKDSTDFWSTVQIAGGAGYLNSILDWKEQSTFNFLMEKFSQPFSPAPEFNAGLRADQGAIAPQQNQALNNSWSMPPVSSYGANDNNTYQQPAYNTGTAMGLGQPYDFGFGNMAQPQGGSLLGGLFKTLIGAAVQTLQELPSAMMMMGNLGGIMGGMSGMGGMNSSPVGMALNALMGGGDMSSMMGMIGGAMGFDGPSIMQMTNMMGITSDMVSMGGMNSMSMGMGMDNTMMNMLYNSLMSPYANAGMGSIMW